jgi:hypothetical protein
MPTPNTTLTALVSVTPVLPTTTQGQASSISVDTTALPYIIYADANTSQIEVLAYNQIAYNKDPILVNGQNQFGGTITIDPTQGDLTIQILGRNYDPLAAAWAASTAYALNFRLVDPNGYVQLVTTAGTSETSLPSFNSTLGASTIDNGVVWKNLGYIAITPTLKFIIIPYVSGSGILIGPPSAVRSYMAQNTCRIEWLEPTYPGVIGTRVMLSTDPNGINPAYVQYGDIVPPSQLSRSGASVLATQSTTAYDGARGTETITTVNTVQQNNYNYMDVPQTAVGGADIFYAMVSTVVQDPNTQNIFESQQNGPITCGYVNLKLVQLTDFLALQRKEDIAGRMITQVNRNYPNLDLSPRSELRDLMIDPVAIELSNMSVREWFSRVSQSVSGLAQIDNTSGNGISDPFNSSSIKQQISRAYGLNADDTQTFIDNQFNVLGERAGLTRLGATSSVVTITFYTYVKPTSSVTFPVGLVVSTVADSQTPALNFTTTGSASISANSINTYYDPVNGWWAVSVPASCQSSGSNTNVGAGTINNIGTGAPSGWYCTNLVAAAFGQDDEINSSFAARILTRLNTGVDSGTRNGYRTTALATPGIVSAIIVAAGDTEMLRDWDSIRQKHVYGCVDIYTRGTSFSEQDEVIAFQYQNTGTFGTTSTYIKLSSINKNTLNAQIPNFSTLPYPLYQAIQLLVTGSNGSFYLGLKNSQFDNVNGYLILNPNDFAYQVVGDSLSQVSVPLVLNGSPATNKAAIASLSTQTGSTTYQLLARYQSPLTDTPAFQPIISVNSVIGQSNLTGTVATNLINLIHTSDFLLNGGSNQAGDIVNVSTTTTTPLTKTITAISGTLVTIDSGMSVTVDINGNLGNVVSVRSSDQSILYGFGTDYTIGSTGPYHTYGLQPLTVTYNVTAVQILGISSQAIFTCNNKFGIGAQVTVNNLTTPQLATQFPSGTVLTVSSSNETSFTVNFTSTLNTAVIATTGTVMGQTIQNNQQVLVTYNQFDVSENLTFISGESQTLSGTAYSTLNNQGFVYNTWLPESYGKTTLTLDGAAFNSDGTVNLSASTGLVGALVPHDSRYIKVTYGGNVMVENQDYVLTVDTTSGTAAIARSAANIGTTRIPDGAAVSVSYFITEAFTFATEYPAFVEILANQIATTKHAAADVLVKAMVANPIDITMTVTLHSNATADTIDPIIRSTIDLVLDNSSGTLYQSELVQQVMSITGVQTVNLPLVKCAKSDGSYDIGVVIPTGTTWIPLSSDPAFATLHTSFPANSFITESPVLPDSTIPSGGEAEAFVGLLYQGQAYTRMTSIPQFLSSAANPQTLASSGSFYIIGTDDHINTTTALSSAYNQKVIITIPASVANPSLLSFFVTYQVYGEGGASDITLSSTEYLTPGRITINYVTGS